MGAFTQSSIVRKFAILVPLCCLSFTPAEAQAVDRQGDWIDPLAVGAAAGLGMAVFTINPAGEGLISDGTFLPAAVAGGLGAALLVRRLANEVYSDEHLRPRFRWTAGGGHGHAGLFTEYSMATRAPLNERWELEGQLLMVNNHQETVSHQQRCGLLGCFEGSYLTDSREEQSLMLLARAAYHLTDRGTWNPTVVAGGGLAATSLALHDQEGVGPLDEPESFLGPVLDGALGVERGGRTRLMAEGGYRLIAMKGPAVDESFGTGGWYVTAGLAFGF